MKTNYIKLPAGVTIHKSIFDTDAHQELRFGGMLNYEMPEGCDLVILMGNRGGGYEPYRCLLPHQIYMDDIKEAFEKEGFEVIYVAPLSARAPFPIAFNGDYGRKRWQEEERGDQRL
jgi:hypothetical protein